MDQGIPQTSDDQRYIVAWSSVNYNIPVCITIPLKNVCLELIGKLWLDCNACEMVSDKKTSDNCKEFIKQISDNKIVCK